jgi:hypothetical protein
MVGSLELLDADFSAVQLAKLTHAIQTNQQLTASFRHLTIRPHHDAPCTERQMNQALEPIAQLPDIILHHSLSV